MQTDPDLLSPAGATASLRRLISNGGFAPGDKLPSERQLIQDMGISRGTLRKALETLERERRIWRHVGKGTFVSTGYQTNASEGLVDMARQMTRLQMVRARLTLEPAIAREAAFNASDASITAIRCASEDAQNAATWAEYETEDATFHRAIATATENPMLLLMFDQLNQIQRSVVWETVVRQTDRPARDHDSFSQHTRIVEAVASRDPARAQDEMFQHIAAVAARLFRVG